MSAPTRDDRILPETRWLSVLIVPILLAGFVILYLFPDDTERLFAWTIAPRMTPLLMGAGYLAGAYFFVRAIFATQWHKIGKGFIAITAFTWPMGLATLLHLDRFNHSHPSFWLWAIVYLVTPLLIPTLYLRNRRADPGVLGPADVEVPRPIRLAMGAVGVAELLIGAAMFLFPSWAIAIWPWQLTPLSARIVAGWFALPGVGGLIVASERRWSASRSALEGAVIWSALLLVAAARAWGDFEQANPLTWVFVGSLGLSLIAIGALCYGMEAHRSARAAVAAAPAGEERRAGGAWRGS
jgi:hypothetical protein